MGEQGSFDKVTIITQSDFGRTLTYNGAGTDHGWGGQHFVISGSLNGGKVFNDYPESLSEGDYILSRSRLIPKYPWESMLVPVAEWMGVTPSHFSVVFPNLANFDMSTHIIGRATLFKA